MNILAIDPGNTQSAAVLYDCIADKPILWETMDNLDMLQMVRASKAGEHSWTMIVVEMVSCYGMPVGAEVFDTVYWIGRFCEAAARYDRTHDRIYRREVKMHLCGTMKAKDANIRQRLIDIFGAPGTKKSPGVLYGMKGDEWAALAVAVTWKDKFGKGSAQ